MKVRSLVDGRFKLAEGPVWCARTQMLWWVNMVDPSAVYRLAWGAAEPDIFPAPQPVTGLALTEDGLVLAGSVGGLLRLDPQSGQFDPVLRLEGDRRGNRCNELGVDPAGNLWVGTMTDNLSGAAVASDAGSLFCIAPDGGQTVVLTGLGIPNTLVWDNMGRLLTADSMTGQMRRITLTAAIKPARIEEIVSPADIGVPDGSAIAEDGTLWNARWSAGCLLGLSPDGGAPRRIDLPGGNITSACFAGPDLQALVVTTSLWGLSQEDLDRQPQVGGIFCIEGVGRGAAAQPRFAGKVSSWPAIILD